MNIIKPIIVSAIVAALAIVTLSLLSINSSVGYFAVVFAASLISALINQAVLASPAPASSENKSRSNAKSKSKRNKASTGQEQGTVKWFNPNKGFGFITRKNGEEIFVHYRSIAGEGRRTLRDGQQVQFNVGEGDKGPQAEDVSAV